MAPAAIAAAVLAPFGLAQAPLELMASALDLIAAIGQTFGERPEAVQAVPRPPDLAFIVCVFALLWACLWRGGLRWLGAPIFAVSVALYGTAPTPVFAFDTDLRAMYGRDGERWTLLAATGRSTYARDRLGAMLGLSPSEIERLAPPEACGDSFCHWRTDVRSVFLVQDATGFDSACVSTAIVIARVEPPPGYAQRCQTAAMVNTTSLAHLGGATIVETPVGPRITRAWSPDTRRAWTPQTTSSDQE